MNNTNERIAACFSSVFPNIRPEEIPRASISSYAGWDSIAQVTLLSAVAEEFGIEFEIGDFEQLVSYAMIADYLESRVIDG